MLSVAENDEMMAPGISNVISRTGRRSLFSTACLSSGLYLCVDPFKRHFVIICKLV